MSTVEVVIRESHPASRNTSTTLKIHDVVGAPCVEKCRHNVEKEPIDVGEDVFDVEDHDVNPFHYVFKDRPQKKRQRIEEDLQAYDLGSQRQRSLRLMTTS